MSNAEGQNRRSRVYRDVLTNRSPKMSETNDKMPIEDISSLLNLTIFAGPLSHFWSDRRGRVHQFP